MPTTASGNFLPLDGLGGDHKYATSSRDTSKLQPLTGSAATYLHFSGAVTLPAITVDFEVTQSGVIAAAITLPRLTALGWFGMQGNVILPKLTGSASGTVPIQGKAAIVLPAVTASGTGLTGAGWQVAASLPLPTVRAFCGARGAAVLPSLVAVGSVSTMESHSFAGVLPLLRVAGNFVLYSSPSHGSIILPALRAGPSGRAAIILPALQAVGLQLPPASSFEAWVLNMHNGAVTRFTNFPFTQFVRFGTKTLGVAADGLYELGGDTDNGTPISWEMETGLDDLGRPGIKHVPYLYLDGIIDGEVEITVIDDRNREFAYQYNTKQRGAIHAPHRRKLGQGIRTRNMAFRIASTTGAYLELDAIEPQVTVTQRSI
jgi:hypothetical protein